MVAISPAGKDLIQSGLASDCAECPKAHDAIGSIASAETASESRMLESLRGETNESPFGVPLEAKVYVHSPLAAEHRRPSPGLSATLPYLVLSGYRDTGVIRFSIR